MTYDKQQDQGIQSSEPGCDPIEAPTPGWVERVIEEKTELFDRIHEVVAFLDTGDIIDPVVIGQMNVQLRTMEAYYTALQNRLEYYYRPPTGV